MKTLIYIELDALSVSEAKFKVERYIAKESFESSEQFIFEVDDYHFALAKKSIDRTHVSKSRTAQLYHQAFAVWTTEDKIDEMKAALREEMRKYAEEMQEHLTALTQTLLITRSSDEKRFEHLNAEQRRKRSRQSQRDRETAKIDDLRQLDNVIVRKLTAHHFRIVNVLTHAKIDIFPTSQRYHDIQKNKRDFYVSLFGIVKKVLDL